MASTATTTIPNGTATSGAIRNFGGKLTGFSTAVTLTGATLTVQGSLDGTTWVTIRSTTGAALSLTAGAVTGFVAVPEAAREFPYLRLISASNEAAERTITLYYRDANNGQL